MNPGSPQIAPKSHVANVNDIQMYYEVYGKGSPLVLLHGFTQAASFWHPFVTDFAAHFKLIVPDLRGHGRSTNPTNQFTHRQVALDIFALLNQLQINQFKAIGFSSGADTLLHLATQQQPRLEAMILIGTGHYWPEQSRVIMRQYTAESEVWDWSTLRQRHVHGDEQIRIMLEQFHNFADNYDDVNFALPSLSTITTRTLIANGDRDPFYPASLAAEMYAAIPNAYLWIVPNGDHFPFRGENARLFAHIALEFLQGHWESNKS